MHTRPQPLDSARVALRLFEMGMQATVCTLPLPLPLPLPVALRAGGQRGALHRVTPPHTLTPNPAPQIFPTLYHKPQGLRKAGRDMLYVEAGADLTLQGYLAHKKHPPP